MSEYWHDGENEQLFFQGHLETIFDCKFCPSNPNHLATASFDGTIKVWDIMTMQTVSAKHLFVFLSLWAKVLWSVLL